MRRAVGRRLAAFVAASAVAGPPFAQAGTAPAEQVRLEPVAAESFVDSVGVNVHLSYDDTNYARFDEVRAALRRMCVQHVRDNVPAEPDRQLARRYADLADDGVEVLVVSGSVGRRDTLSEAGRTVDWLRENDLAPVPVTAVEGANEWDNRGGDDWVRGGPRLPGGPRRRGARAVGVRGGRRRPLDRAQRATARPG